MVLKYLKRNNMIQKYRECYPKQKIYEESVTEHDDAIFFLVRDHLESFLIIMSKNKEIVNLPFEGELNPLGTHLYLKCAKNRHNAQFLRDNFPFTKAVLVGKQNSYGLGDRLGNAGVAHIKAIRKTTFKPVLAQQSIRELQRTNRTAQEDKKTYHITGKPSDIPPDHLLSDEDLTKLLDDNHARQVLHVTFGSILNGKDPISYDFKRRMLQCTVRHEDLYENYLETHFDKHLSPFSDSA